MAIMTKTTEVADGERISEILRGVPEGSKARLLDIIAKAREKKGLTLEEAAVLLGTVDKECSDLILKTAGKIKKDIYGDRLVLFAPLYLSNFCVNDCEYCGFHRRNKGKRKRLETPEIEAEVKALMDMGHKRLLLECGEDPVRNTMDYLIGAISTIYKTRSRNGSIRRVNVNIAPPSAEGFKRLKEAGIGTYQLFQETYHRSTYKTLHNGPKADYTRQILAHDRAFEAGIDDVGLGVLFGLYDYRFEVLALISHARYLDSRFGVGPHTVSVPRLREAPTVDIKNPNTVGDEEILRIIAVLRLAVPYTGLILSTRETPEIRERAFEAGVTQASAASSATPGGYGKGKREGTAQFSLNDGRTVDRFLKDVLSQKLLPSFCTACYRRGRTGGAFMELAKPGDIKSLCGPNAILTFKEYLEDYAPADVRKDGLSIIDKSVKEIKNSLLREETKKRIKQIEAGERDLFF